ncbi:unnamed protein product [Sphenostylis stenocarpa]|uniref:Uncharacterized protein n=1 Tax=Sphenostylis stenocarpa TaxID=92480 RepID=A0AA86RND8_9FABA|nr:unnamed protein product [Sphenostylis stenocarpa]
MRELQRKRSQGTGKDKGGCVVGQKGVESWTHGGEVFGGCVTIECTFVSLRPALLQEKILNRQRWRVCAHVQTNKTCKLISFSIFKNVPFAG